LSGDNVRLSPDIRGAFRKLAKTNLTVTRIAETFKTTRQTVYRWLKRGQHRGQETFKDKPREPKECKVTVEVELSILKLRTTFKWGTARIQQGIYNLPSFILESVNCIQGVVLSRETINNVLSRNNQNGYQHEFKLWKFFRASEPDELWQIDFKGPFSVQGKKYWFLVCIDDYSRFIIAAEQFDHELTTAQTVAVLEKQTRFPKAILFLIMDRSLRSNGRVGAVCMVLKRILPIHLILRTRVKLNGAFKTSIENLLIHCASFLDGLKVK
jgi:hypothetical protein